MTRRSAPLDRVFLEKQRHRLNELRTQILGIRRRQEAEDESTNADVNQQEDDAQRLTSLELQAHLAALEDQRLMDVERALRKIDEGTYGLSDGSGAPIPIDRLEAYPEALYTLEEQNSRSADR